MFFRPRMPAQIVIKEFRSFCDGVALSLLTKEIEGEASATDLIIAADQKLRFVELWYCIVRVIGVAEREGPSSVLCREASLASMAENSTEISNQLLASKIAHSSIGVEDRGREILNRLEDEAFGLGAFDHSKTTKAFPGPDLGMCLRYATHLMKTHKPRFLARR